LANELNNINDEALSLNEISKSKLDDSRMSIEHQFKSLNKRSNSSAEMSKFAKLRSMHKKPLTENEDGNMIINASDFNGNGKLMNVK